MNLAEAVLGIADELEKEKFSESDTLLIKYYARLIRSTVTLFQEGTSPSAPFNDGRVQKILGGTDLPTPAMNIPVIETNPPFHSADPWVDAIKKGEVERQQKILQKEMARNMEILKETTQREERGTGMTYLVGGDLDGDMVPVDPGMPVGAKTLMAGQVYVLKADKNLHYSKEDTEKFKERK
jgi:hypothetical protein